MSAIEWRTAPEIRMSGRVLHGLAAPFNMPADIGGMFTETILPSAFRGTLAAGRSIPALADHDTTRLLGRTHSGSLRLAETAAGLEYSLDLPETSLGKDIAELARRGDLAGMSFAFVATDQSWPDPRTRQLRAVDLHEVSIISGGAPAYSGTSVALRSRDAAGPGPYARRTRLLELYQWA